MGRRAVFVDRDGTLNRQIAGYVSSPDELEVFPEAADALAPLAPLGIPIILISNQQGIGKGLMTDADLQSVEEKLRRELSRTGVELAAAYYCPHLATDMCDCRKPQPGLLLRASADLDIDLDESYLVGDSVSDMAAGRNAGVTTVMVPTGLNSAPSRPEERSLVDYFALDLSDAVRWICERIS